MYGLAVTVVAFWVGVCNVVWVCCLVLQKKKKIASNKNRNVRPADLQRMCYISVTMCSRQ